VCCSEKENKKTAKTKKQKKEYLQNEKEMYAQLFLFPLFPLSCLSLAVLPFGWEEAYTIEGEKYFIEYVNCIPSPMN
jgi:hypothetical protein